MPKKTSLQGQVDVAVEIRWIPERLRSDAWFERTGSDEEKLNRPYEQLDADGYNEE